MAKKTVLDRVERAGVLTAQAEIAKVPRAKRMAIIKALDPTKSDKQCAVEAGYPPDCDAWQIKQTKRYQHAVVDINQVRRELQQKYSLPVLIGRLDGLATNQEARRLLSKARKIAQEDPDQANMLMEEARLEHVSPDVRRKAIGDIIEHTGQASPKQIDVAHKGLFLQFSNLSASDLQALTGGQADGETD